MNREQGFTLIQVMMTVALVGIIGLLSTPLTGAIVHDANVSNAESALSKAIGKAKSIALRNEPGLAGDVAVSAICVSSTNVLTVESGTVDKSPNCSTSDGSVVWTTTLSGGTSIKTKNTDVYVDTSCLCFGRKGILTAAACAAVGCATSTEFEIGSGGRTEELMIF